MLIGVALTLHLLIAPAHLGEPAPHIKACALPLVVDVDGEQQKTSLIIKAPLLEIHQPMEKWLSEKHDSPDDATLSTILTCVKNRQGDVLKKIVGDSAGIENAKEALDWLHGLFFQDGCTTLVGAKLFTDQGTIYRLENRGKGARDFIVFVKAVDQAAGKYEWELTGGRDCDFLLMQSFDLRSATIGNATVGRWNDGQLAQALIGAVSNDPKLIRGIRDCMKLIVSSQMKEGVTEKSLKRLDQISQMDAGHGRDLRLDKADWIAKLLPHIAFVIDANPVYFAFFQFGSGATHECFIERNGRFLLTNQLQPSVTDDYLGKFGEGPVVQEFLLQKTLKTLDQP